MDGYRSTVIERLTLLTGETPRKTAPALLLELLYARQPETKPA